MGLVFDRWPQVLQRELLPILGLLHPRHAPLHPRHPRRDCLRVRWSSPPSHPRARVVPLAVGRRGAEGRRGEGRGRAAAEGRALAHLPRSDAWSDEALSRSLRLDLDVFAPSPEA